MARVSIDDIDKKRYARLALKWCKENLGVNPRRKTPTLVILKKSYEKNVVGQYVYTTNRIEIYEKYCDTIYELIATIIHEYTHHLQSNKKYWEYFKYYYYYDHPFEKEAQKNELKYTKICFRYINKNL